RLRCGYKIVQIDDFVLPWFAYELGGEEPAGLRMAVGERGLGAREGLDAVLAVLVRGTDHPVEREPGGQQRDVSLAPEVWAPLSRHPGVLPADRRLRGPQRGGAVETVCRLQEEN